MAVNLGADSKLSQCVDAYIHEIEDDFSAPQQSSFQDFMPKVKRDIQSMEEVNKLRISQYKMLAFCRVYLLIKVMFVS